MKLFIIPIIVGLILYLSIPNVKNICLIGSESYQMERRFLYDSSNDWSSRTLYVLINFNNGFTKDYLSACDAIYILDGSPTKTKYYEDLLINWNMDHLLKSEIRSNLTAEEFFEILKTQY